MFASHFAYKYEGLLQVGLPMTEKGRGDLPGPFASLFETEDLAPVTAVFVFYS
ncbi:hypothetical protein [Numidum massiliense]|uniref:hypothetical protein n=1 Tax=Numidum massiliense TaxID=1522315 RepID=UPI00164CE38F|nr:hypothetical protein [Numidum massiliense]